MTDEEAGSLFAAIGLMAFVVYVILDWVLL